MRVRDIFWLILGVILFGVLGSGSYYCLDKIIDSALIHHSDWALMVLLGASFCTSFMLGTVYSLLAIAFPNRWLRLAGSILGYCLLYFMDKPFSLVILICFIIIGFVLSATSDEDGDFQTYYVRTFSAVLTVIPFFCCLFIKHLQFDQLIGLVLVFATFGSAGLALMGLADFFGVDKRMIAVFKDRVWGKVGLLNELSRTL